VIASTVDPALLPPSRPLRGQPWLSTSAAWSRGLGNRTYWQIKLTATIVVSRADADV